MKLNNKIVITVLAPLIVSCIFLAWSTQQFVKHAANKSVIMNNSTISRHVANQFYEDGSTYIALLSSVAKRPVFTSYIEAKPGSSKQKLAAKKLNEMLTTVIHIQPRLLSLRLINQQGKLKVSAGEQSILSVQDLSKSKNNLQSFLKSEKKSLINIQKSKDLNTFITIALNINETNNIKDKLVLIAQISTQPLLQEITEFSQQENNQLLLVDNDYNVVFAPKTEPNWLELNPSDELSTIAAYQEPTEIYINDQYYMAMQLQHFSPGSSPYYTFVLQSKSKAQHALYKKLALPLSYILIIMVLIAILLYYSLNRIVITKISKITMIVDNIANNEFDLFTRVKEEDELDQLTNRLVNIVDMQGQYNQEIQQAACYDNLTNLSNRYLFNQLLEQEVERCMRYKKRFALIYLDVDGFKRLNDNYGHPFGDKVLIKFSEILQEQVRESDVVGRWSAENNVARLAGDEFAILLTELKDSFPALHVVKRILETLEQPVDIDGQKIILQTSIGIAHYPGDAETADMLIKNADAAMYQAKSIGRNQFKIFSKELNEKIIRQETVYQALIFALASDEFELHFQPYIHAQTGKIAGAEALLRWTSSSLGQVGPAEFIPIAEQYGLVTEIDRWVMRNAMKILSELKLAEKNIRLSINVSNLHFHNRFFPEFMVNCMDEFDIGPDQFELEITETAMTDLDDQFLEVANAVSAIGVSLVLDDFGTGFTSLSHLSHLPITKIKIDRSHVIEISSQTDGIRLVDVLLSISDSYKLKITAEGVEEIEQRDYLAKNQCDYLQGYLFYRPMPVAQFNEALEKDLESKV